jgi:putative tricarboxylic transport membrane protein
MNKREQLGGLFWLGIAVFVCAQAWKSEIGSLGNPGPGFFPFWSAVVLGLFASALLIVSSARKHMKRTLADLWRGTQWQKVIWIMCSLFLYLLTMPKVGFVVTTFALMLSLTAIIEQRRAWRHGVSALIIVAASYLVFKVILDVRLPKGIFGF